MAGLLLEKEGQLEQYLERVRMSLLEVPAEERMHLLQQARAQIDLALELDHGSPRDGDALGRVLRQLGEPEALAQKLRAEAPIRTEEHPLGRLGPCRSCRKEVSVEAPSCPHCGAPRPAQQSWRGWGYEWTSKTRVLGWPLVHVAYGRDQNGKLRVAKGIIAIGQFGIGAITIAQFGIAAIFGIGQFMLAPLALGQFAFGLAAAGQFGIGLIAGAGQFATGAWKAIGQITFGNFWK